jgi:hypothetical protein
LEKIPWNAFLSLFHIHHDGLDFLKSEIAFARHHWIHFTRFLALLGRKQLFNDCRKEETDVSTL